MRQTYSDLHLITLDMEGHLKTCDYWYLVRTPWFAHTAFNRRESLLQYLAERGLELTSELPEHGKPSTQDLRGSYRTEMHGSYDEFYALNGVRSRTLSNGDWTLAIITTDEDGIKTVHVLNPNCRDRPVYDHRESRATMG